MSMIDLVRRPVAGLSDRDAKVLFAGWAVSCVVLVAMAISGSWGWLAILLIPVSAWLVTYTAALMLVAALSAGMLALAAAPIALGLAAGYFGLFVAVPAAGRLLWAGPAALVAVVTGEAAASVLAAIGAAALSGLLTGTAVGVVQSLSGIKDKRAETLLKALFSKDLWNGEEGAWQKVVLSAAVGLVVGAAGGAAGILGFFGTVDASSVMDGGTALRTVLGPDGGEGGLAAALVAFLLVVLAVVLHGVLIGALAGVLVGAAVGGIKGALYGAAKEYNAYGNLRERSRIGPAMRTGFANGALSGAIVGLLHGLATAWASLVT